VFFASTPQGVAKSFTVHNGRLKLIQMRVQNGWTYRAYDLERDPKERTNLLRKTPGLLQQAPFAEWKVLLERYAGENEAARKKVPQMDIDVEDREMLEALGYAGN
jgi:hypothetical protein